MNEQFRDDLTALIEKHKVNPDQYIADMGRLIIVSAFNNGTTLDQILEYFRILWSSYEKYSKNKEE